MAKYSTTWVGPKYVWPISKSVWAVALGVIEDQNGKRRLRLAKGKRTAEGSGGAPIGQGQKLNFASVEQARGILTKALAALDEIEISGEMGM